MKLWNKHRSGSSTIEFVFVGIPLIFVLISIFEMGRLMWSYNVLAHSVKEAARYAAVHGNDCGAAPNSCTVTVGDVARRMSARLPAAGNIMSPVGQGVGLVPEDFRDIRFIRGLPGDPTPLQFTDLNAALASATPFPSGGAGATAAGGGNPDPVTIRAEYETRSALSLFWPGSGYVMFGPIRLHASATEMIHY